MEVQSGPLIASLVPATGAAATTFLLGIGKGYNEQAIKFKRTSKKRRKKRRRKWGPFISLLLEEEDLTYAILMGEVGNKNILGSNYGPWYIQPRSIHWWEQFWQIDARRSIMFSETFSC